MTMMAKLPQEKNMTLILQFPRLSYLFNCNSIHFCQTLDQVWDRPGDIKHALSVVVRSSENIINKLSKTIKEYDKTRLKEMYCQQYLMSI